MVIASKLLTSYDKILTMNDDAMVFVSIETLVRQANDLVGDSNSTREDNMLLDEIEEILSDNRGKKDVLLTCKVVKRLISEKNVNVYSFTQPY